jgi:di/tricarboxylate transporter
MLSTSLLSAFLNNTPIVAMFTPRVQQWANKLGRSPSLFLIPLSYSAIVGGLITLIGTSTNIVVSGLMEEHGLPALGMFDLRWIGLPAALAVAIYFALIGHRLLPDRHAKSPAIDKGLKDCMFDLQVSDRSPMIGRTVEESRLRSLGGAYLAHVDRHGHLIQAGPGEVLQSGDVLTFVGDSTELDKLLELPGLERVVSAIDISEDHTLPLYEAVVAPTSYLAGRTLREVSFREQYGGVVLAIQRRDKQRTGSLGRIRLQAGDLLLIEASTDFARRWNAKREEFYIVSPNRPRRKKPKLKKAPLAICIMLGMVVVAATGVLPLVTAGFVAALAMVGTRCLRLGDARRAVDMSVLIVIAAALGIGKAVEVTGLAAVMADGIVGLTRGWGVVGVLVALYVSTNVLTELITHKAAAVLMVPVALAAALDLGYNPKAFALVVAVGAAASFMTPIGYQTNLMVMAAGGYQFKDYFKAGLPVSLLVMTIAVGITYWIWI